MEGRFNGIKRLNAEIRECNKCILSKTRISALTGEGKLNARLMLIAQASGKNEDQERIMFIGPSGKVLDELLQISDFDRKELYMTNIVKCMLLKYRKPKEDEIDIFSGYLDREVKLVDPKILVPLGHCSTTYIFKKYNLLIPSKQDFYGFYGYLFLSASRKILPLRNM